MNADERALLLAIARYCRGPDPLEDDEIVRLAAIVKAQQVETDVSSSGQE